MEIETMSERIERLEAIKEEIEELLQEATQLVRGTSEEGRARSYWCAHIRCALDNTHSYLGGSMCTIQDSADALRKEMTPVLREVLIVSTSNDEARVFVDNVLIGRATRVDVGGGPTWVVIVNDDAGEEDEFGRTEWEGSYPGTSVHALGVAMRECVERIGTVIVNGVEVSS